MVKGLDKIIDLHDCLYENEFRSLDKGLPYVPHITVGKLPNVQELEMAYEEVKNIDYRFDSIVDKVSVERIGPNEESIIIIEKELV